MIELERLKEDLKRHEYMRVEKDNRRIEKSLRRKWKEEEDEEQISNSH